MSAQALLDRIRDALQFVDASDRDKWVSMGMAIKSEIGETGFEVWEAWSQQAESYNGRDARDVWKSIRETGKVTIGTLFYEAKSNGWRDDGKHPKPTPAELAERRRIAAERAALEEAEIARQRAETAAKAKAVWDAATEAQADHPYLQRKQVSPVATLREIDASEATAILGYTPKAGSDALSGRLLVVPVKQGDRLSTLELIDGDSRKAALAGRGTKAGGHWATERLPDGDGSGMTVLIGEGAATVLSASAATGSPGIAALSSGNLPAVAKAMRQRYPKAALVVLADLVKATGEPDPHAVEAARVAGGRLAVPDFGADRDQDMKDMNDLAAISGLEVVAKAVANARNQKRDARMKMEAFDSKTQRLASELMAEVQIIRGDKVRVKPIDWLWKGFLAAGKLHVLAGAPGTGKTTIAQSLAAAITNGAEWPDGTQAERGDILMWSGEDDISDTLAPRFYAAGADMRRVHFIGGVFNGKSSRAFDPATDFHALEQRIKAIGPRLVIVDPIVSAVAGDSHKGAEVRRGLQPIVDVARAHGCAVIGISHFSKNTSGRDPLERVTGSLAFGALARVVLVTAKAKGSEDDEPRRVMARAKSNIGPDGGGFAYSTEIVKTSVGLEASRVRWLEALDGSARDVLAEAEADTDDEEGTSKADVDSFLRGLLSDGPVKVKQLQADTNGAGYSWDQVKRASNRLGVEKRKESMSGGWVWALGHRREHEECEEGEGSRVQRVHPSVHPSEGSSEACTHKSVLPSHPSHPSHSSAWMDEEAF